MSSSPRRSQPPLEDDDESATLEAVLAFLESSGSDADLELELDAGDLDASPPGSDDLLSEFISTATIPTGRGSALVAQSGASQQQQQFTVQSTQNRPAASRKRRKTATVPAFRRQPKIEILELRDQVAQLSTRLASLQQQQSAIASVAQSTSDEAAPSSRGDAERDSHTRSAAINRAEAELQTLAASRELNAELKATWRKQITLARKLETMLKKQIAGPIADGALAIGSEPLVCEPLVCEPLVCEQQTIVEREETVLRDTVRLFAKLHRHLELLHHQAVLSIALITLRDTTRVFNSSHGRQDLGIGQVFEFTTNAPLVCSLGELEMRIWNAINSTKTARDDPNLVVHADARAYTTSSYEHKYSHTFDCEFGSIYVDTVAMICKATTVDRVVIAFTSLGSIVGTEFTFQESGWLLLLSQSSSGSFAEEASSSSTMPPSTLLQTRYRIQAENWSAAMSVDDSAASLQNFILQTFCEKMRGHHLNLQTSLTEEFGRKPISLVPSFDADRFGPVSGCPV